MSQDLAFSVVLPVYHGGNVLRQTLASLREIDFPPDDFEVLVAGPAEAEEAARVTCTLAADAAFNVKYVPSVSAHRPVELNAACSAARGRVLAFTDEHCVVPPDWLRKLAEVLEREPDAGIVGGPDEVMYSGTRFGPALDWVLSSFVGTAGCRREGGLSAGKYYPRMCNMGIPRRVALAAALKAGDGPLRVFNESLNVHENVDLANRVEQLGKRIVYAPELCITNRRDTTFFSFLRRNFDMARAARTLGAHRLPHALVTISVLGFLALAVMAVFFQVFGVLLGVCVVMYALTLLCSALAAAKKTKRLDVLVAVPLLLLGIHLARGFGYLFPLSCREGAAGNA